MDLELVEVDGFLLEHLAMLIHTFKALSRLSEVLRGCHSPWLLLLLSLRRFLNSGGLGPRVIFCLNYRDLYLLSRGRSLGLEPVSGDTFQGLEAISKFES